MVWSYWPALDVAALMLDLMALVLAAVGVIAVIAVGLGLAFPEREP